MIDNAPTRHLMSPSKTSRSRNKLHHIESLAEVVLWKPPKHHIGLSSIDFSPQPYSKTLLMKTALIYAI